MIHKLIGLHRGQRGITGLETAIILIAFVVVAAVFAYTVLSAGLFSTQKSQQAVHSGLDETRSTIELRGNVIAYKGDGVIDSTVGKVEICVANAVDSGETIDVTPPYVTAGGTLLASGWDNQTLITYIDKNVTVSNCAWTVSFIGKTDGDYDLEDGEKAVITIWLHTYDGAAWADGASGTFLATYDLDTNQQFMMEIKPAAGAVLSIERTMPSYLDTVIDLH